MNLIKPCPSCGKLLRFPVDKGKISVRCSCGNAFIADPNDTTLYKNSRFDLSRKPSVTPFRSLKKIFSSVDIKKLKRVPVNSLLNLKYGIQNLGVLAWGERKKILIKMFLFIMAVVVIFFILSRTLCATKGVVV